MTAGFLFVDNIVSTALVVVCWLLAHKSASGRGRFGRLIAAGYGLLAMTAMAAMMVHNIEDLRWLAPYAELAGRAVVAVTLGAVALRMTWCSARPE